MSRERPPLFLIWFVIVGAIWMPSGGCDAPPKPAAPSGNATNATDTDNRSGNLVHSREEEKPEVKEQLSNTDLLCRHWVYSGDEQRSGDSGQLFRPAGSREFPGGLFRMEYKFSNDGTCEWMWMSPNDGHRMLPGKWSWDSEDPTMLRIDKGFGTKVAFRITELSSNAMRLLQVEQVNDR